MSVQNHILGNLRTTRTFRKSTFFWICSVEIGVVVKLKDLLGAQMCRRDVNQISNQKNIAKSSRKSIILHIFQNFKLLCGAKKARFRTARTFRKALIFRIFVPGLRVYIKKQTPLAAQTCRAHWRVFVETSISGKNSV